MRKVLFLSLIPILSYGQLYTVDYNHLKKDGCEEDFSFISLEIWASNSINESDTIYTCKDCSSITVNLPKGKSYLKSTLYNSNQTSADCRSEVISKDTVLCNSVETVTDSVYYSWVVDRDTIWDTVEDCIFTGTILLPIEKEEEKHLIEIPEIYSPFEEKGEYEEVPNIVYIPSAINPESNNYYNNRLWVFNGEGSYHIRIYDRYGGLIWENKKAWHFDLGWGGYSNNGLRVNNGVYVYVITNESNIYTGDVTVTN